MDFMSYALEIAARAKGTCKPNPAVGAVVVRAGRVVGEGATQPAGSAHAEIVALGRARARARGAVLYVTLEPCSHHGRTAPCVDAVIGAGIAEVHVAMIDPSPWVAGQGLDALRAAGLRVILGEHADQARRLNLPYFTWVEQGRPYVTGVCRRHAGDQATSVSRGTAAISDSDDVSGSLRDADVIVVDQVWRGTDRCRGGTPHPGDAAESSAHPPGVLTVTLTADGTGGAAVSTWRGLLGLLAERRVQHVVLDAPPSTIEALRQAGLVDRVMVEPVGEILRAEPGETDVDLRERSSVQEVAGTIPNGGRFACSRGS